MSVYDLFNISATASPSEILQKCKDYCAQWTLTAVLEKLTTDFGPVAAANNAQAVYSEGEIYLKSTAAVLFDPGARQCYDAWLDAVDSDSPEKKKLTRSRLLWFNDTAAKVCFSESMIKALGDSALGPHKKAKIRHKFNTHPECRICRAPFELSERHLVLHCHCTTRVGHPECLARFSKSVSNKCPVCRQHLLKRHQVSKYLFWNVKEKYKFVS